MKQRRLVGSLLLSEIASERAGMIGNGGLPGSSVCHDRMYEVELLACL